ncbi:MAG: helix-turn-helix domain-containing protein, partial [Rubripirellula sp.]
MPAKQPEFSPKQVAQSLDVSESSVKRWCDRGVIPTVKTSGGHRRISLDGLHDFLQTSDRLVVNPDALGFPVLPGDRRQSIPGNRHPVQAAFREALANGDESKCEELVRRWMADGWSRSEACSDLFTDALHGIGEAWECRQVDAYQERVACGICMRLIQTFRQELPVPTSSAPVAIGGTLSGDYYEIPSALVDLTLRESGWNSQNLGINLPVESYVQASNDHQPVMVWISVSNIQDEQAFVAAQNRLANSLNEDVSLIVGGRALSDKTRPKLRYTAHCDSLGHLSQ